jgi:hypothetical protein
MKDLFQTTLHIWFWCPSGHRIIRNCFHCLGSLSILLAPKRGTPTLFFSRHPKALSQLCECDRDHCGILILFIFPQVLQWQWSLVSAFREPLQPVPDVAASAFVGRHERTQQKEWLTARNVLSHTGMSDPATQLHEEVDPKHVCKVLYIVEGAFSCQQL